MGDLLHEKNLVVHHDIHSHMDQMEGYLGLCLVVFKKTQPIDSTR